MRTTTDAGSFRVRAISIAMGKGADPMKFPFFFIVLFFFCSTTPKNHSLDTLQIFKDLSCITISLVNKKPHSLFSNGVLNLSPDHTPTCGLKVNSGEVQFRADAPCTVLPNSTLLVHSFVMAFLNPMRDILWFVRVEEFVPPLLRHKKMLPEGSLNRR